MQSTSAHGRQRDVHICESARDFQKMSYNNSMLIFFTGPFFPSHNFFMPLSHCRFLHNTIKTNQAVVRKDGLATYTLQQWGAVSLCLLCFARQGMLNCVSSPLVLKRKKWFEILSWPQCLTLHTLLWHGIPTFRNWVRLPDVNLDFCANEWRILG